MAISLTSSGFNLNGNDPNALSIPVYGASRSPSNGGGTFVKFENHNNKSSNGEDLDPSSSAIVTSKIESYGLYIRMA